MSMKIIIRTGERQHNFLLHGEDVCKTVAEVKQFCYCRFPHLENDKDLKIYWSDQDGDDICVVTDGDYRSFLVASDKEKRRLYVEGTEAEAQVDAPVRPVQNAPDHAAIPNRPVHSRIICDVCDQTIVGHRYRCLTCHDYDLCMTCESKFRHKDHIMLRIPRPTVDSWMQTHRVFQNLEHHANQLKLIPECPSPDSRDVGEQRSAETDVPVAKATPRAELRHQPTSNQHGRCPAKSRFSAMHKANVAAAAMVHERAQARFREVLSRYVDPANISGTVETPSPSSPSSSANVGTNGAPSASPQSPANEEVLTEAQRSLKLASEAAKVASAAAAASWNTFMGCAGMFVPVINPSSPSSPTAMGAAQNQQATTPPQQQASSGANGGTGSNASVVSGLVDDVLKLTPPELKEFLPNEDEMNRLGEKLSTLLSQLGIELNMPPTETDERPASSSVASNNEAQQKASDERQIFDLRSTTSEEVKQDGHTVSVASPDTNDQLAATVASKEPERASQSSKPSSIETDSAGGRVCLDWKQFVEEGKGAKKINDECSADTSSASLLTDDDEDVLEGAQMSEQSNPPVASSTGSQAVPWILVDLPDDREAEVQQRKVVATSSTSTEKVDEAMAVEAPEEDDEGALLNLIEYSKKRLEMLRKKSLKHKTEGQDDRLKGIFDEVTKELEKLEKDRVGNETKEEIAASVSEPVNEKKISPQAAAAWPVSSSTTPAPSTAAPRGSPDATIAGMPRTQTAAAPLRTYSPRPHVNHAIHTMMTMGFSNNDGHLTQLLEALNGDIPRALDLLMQKLS